MKRKNRVKDGKNLPSAGNSFHRSAPDAGVLFPQVSVALSMPGDNAVCVLRANRVCHGVRSRIARTGIPQPIASNVRMHLPTIEDLPECMRPDLPCAW